jgi:hypothetical protein
MDAEQVAGEPRNIEGAFNSEIMVRAARIGDLEGSRPDSFNWDQSAIGDLHVLAMHGCDVTEETLVDERDRR